ncbi:MAG: hypothetical protein NTX79_01760 [Candidatus Micrarchaeota archaeon]|nr:hypothetical protein [Candidatus Micrarchaeota archaeon]
MENEPLKTHAIEPLSPQFGTIQTQAGIAQAQETARTVAPLTRKRSTNSTQKRTRAAKEQMLKALERTMGTVSLAARLAGIDRGTHYHWLARDPKYKEAVWLVEEELKDTLESVAYSMALNKNPQILLATLKAKCKDRGWGDSPQTAMHVNTQVNPGPTITIEQFKAMARKAVGLDKENDYGGEQGAIWEIKRAFDEATRKE